MKKVCSVKDCRKPVRSKGFCNVHYLRYWKYGSPTKGRALNGEPKRYMLAHMNDDCPKWPFSSNQDGRGVIRYRGKSRLVHQIVCELIHGPKPSKIHEAAHNCGKGHVGCFGSRCVEWKTPKENNEDKTLHGTAVRGETQWMAKLSANEVLLIRKMKNRSPTELARKYSVSPATIHDIWKRRSWDWL